MYNYSFWKRKGFFPLLIIALAACQPSQPAGRFRGPLRVNPANPRYFTDNSGQAIYLAGAHTWANNQEIDYTPSEPFDYTGYLDFLERHNLNFIRFWTWENSAWLGTAPDTVKGWIGPAFRYRRTGPGLALDSLPRFDLTQLNRAYFERVRSRVAEAGRRGFYVMLMLFQGFSIERKGSAKGDSTRGNPWWGHPFNLANNVNGIDGDKNGNGEGEEVNLLVDEKIIGLEKDYIRKIVDTVNDLDNVLYEISNESSRESTAWQYAMIDYLHEYEKTRPKQHPVVMTFQYPGGANEALFNSPAEAVSPNEGENQQYKNDPPAAGKKVILSDTDHLWGIGGDRVWVWKSFLRGLNPVFMDPYEWYYDIPELKNHPDSREWEEVRKNLGYTRIFAGRMNLNAMTPRGELASSGYCLAKPAAEAAEYLVYLPQGGSVEVDLTGSPGPLVCEWFDPASGSTADIWTAEGGGKLNAAAPFGGQAVLYIHRPEKGAPE